MEEIEFRAWDRVDKMMYYSVQNGILFDDGSEYTFKNFLENEGYHIWEIMQFTGLKDKNGNKIYASDLVKLVSYSFQHFNKYTYQVYYNVDEAMFKFRNNVKYPHNIDECIHGLHSFEVIGNIYQNPELVKH